MKLIKCIHTIYSFKLTNLFYKDMLPSDPKQVRDEYDSTLFKKFAITDQEGFTDSGQTRLHNAAPLSPPLSLSLSPSEIKWICHSCLRRLAKGKPNSWTRFKPSASLPRRSEILSEEYRCFVIPVASNGTLSLPRTPRHLLWMGDR